MRRLIAAASMTVTMTLAALGLHDSPVSAVAKPTLAVALSPSSAIAGSTGNTLTFTFVAIEASTSRATVTIPASAIGAPWSPPQTANPSGPGYVTVQSVGCNSAVLTAIAGAGPWTLAVDYKCGSNKSFALTYRAKAAERADAYVFATQAKVGQVFLPTTTQPVVTVTPAAASTLTMTGLAAATAGAAQSATVQLYDAFGNLATGYLGTVHFTANDPQMELPADYAFTAADAGTRAFTNAVVLKTAGSRTVTATGTAVALPGTQTVNVSPGSAASFAVTGLVTAIAGTAQTATATAKDAYGNVASGYGGAAVIASSDPQADLPSSDSFVNGARTFAVTLKTSGSRSVSATDGLVTGSQTVAIQAAAASVMSLTGLADTTAAGASQSGFVTLFDAYSNVANGYVGTVHFISDPHDALAALPADHTFTATDNGSYSFTGLVLTKAGSTSIVVTDTLVTSLQAVKTETVLPGPVVSLALTWGDKYLRFTSFAEFLPAQRNCNVTPKDAYENPVLTYTGEIEWTTTPGIADGGQYFLPAKGVYQPPPSALVGSAYLCVFYGPGTHGLTVSTRTLTVTDVNNPTLTDTKTFVMVPPSPKPDDFTVLDPTHRSGLTVHTLSPLNNDWQYPPQRPVFTLASVGQATFMENGTKYQLGVAQLDAAKRNVLWELNPPNDATPSDPDATLRRCYPDGVGCTVTQPITMPYTVTDSVNSADSTMALHLSTPPALFPAPTITVVSGHYAEPSDAPGFLIPPNLTLSIGALSTPNPLTGVLTTNVSGTLPAGSCGASGCTFTTNASFGLPTDPSGNTLTLTAGSTLNLGHALTVTTTGGSGTIDQLEFHSVLITQAQDSSPNAPEPAMISVTLFSMETTKCRSLATGGEIPCPVGDHWVLDLVGLEDAEIETVKNHLFSLGYSVSTSCTSVPTASSTGKVTGVGQVLAFNIFGVRIPTAAVSYSKVSCP